MCLAAIDSGTVTALGKSPGYTGSFRLLPARGSRFASGRCLGTTPCGGHHQPRSLPDVLVLRTRRWPFPCSFPFSPPLCSASWQWPGFEQDCLIQFAASLRVKPFGIPVKLAVLDGFCVSDPRQSHCSVSELPLPSPEFCRVQPGQGDLGDLSRTWEEWLQDCPCLLVPVRGILSS